IVHRFDANVPGRFWQAFTVFLPIAVIVHLLTNWTWGLYGEMWRHASVAEARRVILAGVASMLVLIVADVAALHRVPLSVVILGSGATTLMVGVTRFQSRLFAFHRATAVYGAGLRVAVVGAGEAGAAIVREIGRASCRERGEEAGGG